jgi:hypothetical protein
LDAIDTLTGSPTNFPDLPPGTRAVSLPDNSYNRTTALLKVFGRPEGLSVCECERVDSASLSQSLHLLNSADLKAKVSGPNGRADRLMKANGTDAEKIRSLYLTAFARLPSAEEMQEAEGYLKRSVTDAAGQPLDPAKAKRRSLEDLIWALLNTKEFFYNH